MSDESVPVRNDNDPAARVAADLRARLRSLPAGELVDLCAELLTTYVVEGVLPLARAGESGDLAADAVGEESFAQMLKRLKAGKKDPVLERFLIDGENITVRIDGYGMLPLTEYRRPVGPPGGPAGQAPPPPRRETVPGASTSIYNRGLYAPEEQAAPPPARGAPPAPQPRPAQAQPPPQQPAGKPAPAAPGQPQKKDEQPKNDRFSLIELE